MLRALAQIGEYNMKLSSIVEANYVLVAQLDKEHNFLGLGVEVFDIEDSEKYLYMPKGNSKNSYITPCFVKSREALLKETSDVVKTFAQITEEFLGKPVMLKEEEIRENVQDLGNAPGVRVMLTVKVENKYLGQIEKMQEKARASRDKWFTSKKHAGYGVCAICGETRLVIGGYFPLTIYTVDNKAYAPELNERRAYTHMPICSSCLELIRNGAEFMKTGLKFNTAGLEYYFLPEPLFMPAGFKKLYEKLLNALREERIRNMDPERIAKELQGRLSVDHLNWLRVHLVFTKEKKENNSMRILSLIEEVFPSRLGYIYKLVEDINMHYKDLPEYGILSTKTKFSVGNIRNIVPDLDSFFRLLRVAYLKEHISDERLVDLLMSGLKKGIGDKDFKDMNRKVVLVYHCYLMFKVYLFIRLAMEGKDMNLGELREDNLEEVFDKYFGGNQALVGLALLGWLVRRIEKVQYAKGYNADFGRKIAELGGSWESVEKLIGQLGDKARKYDLGKEFFEQYSRATVKLSEDARNSISRNKIKLALYLGYSLGYTIKPEEVKDESEETTDQQA